MNPIHQKFLAATSTALALSLVGARADDPSQYYVMPDTIKDAAEIIGFDELEISALKSVGEPAKEAFEAARAEVSAAEDAVRKQLEDDPLDQESVMPLVDRWLKAENAVKRIEAKALIELNRLLTTDQRTELMALQSARKKFGASIESMVDEVKALAQSGTVPADILEREKLVGEAIKADIEQGRLEAAHEAIGSRLDRLKKATDS